MKKTFIYMTAAVAAMAFSSCGSNATKAGEADSVSTASASAGTYKVDVAGSSIEWKGTKAVGVGEHNGTISIKEGDLSVENGNITAGKFYIDMNSIKNLDLTDTAYANKLIGHFRSDDFFNVEKFPTASFEITKVEAKAEGENTHLISGNLTLRDVTKNISIPAKVDINDAGLVATGAVVINRLDWGINYDKEKMSLTEKAQQAAKNGIVSKDIQLKINLKATK